LTDDDWHGHPPDGISNLAVFIGQVRLAVILETLLPLTLYEDQPGSSPSKVHVLPSAVRSLKSMFDGLGDLAYRQGEARSRSPGQGEHRGPLEGQESDLKLRYSWITLLSSS
jgi:hypothetical protein